MAANPNLASGTAILGSIGTSTLVAYNSSKTSFGQVTMKQTGDDMFWYYQQPNTAETDQPYIKFSDEQVTISSKSGNAGRRIVVSSQGVYLNGTEVGDLGTGGGGGGGGSASGETVDIGTGSTKYRLAVNEDGELEIVKRDLTDPLNVIESRVHVFKP